MVADSRREKIERTAVLPAPRADVWDALTRSDLLSAWYGGDVTIDARPGGVVRIIDADGDRRGTVEDVEPGRRLAVRVWSAPSSASAAMTGSRIEFVLDEAGDDTRLTVIESRLGRSTGSSRGAVTLHA